ncbi:uncharacterized protein V6R79_016192 [Siganus canaliculatus]
MIEAASASASSSQGVRSEASVLLFKSVLSKTCEMNHLYGSVLCFESETWASALPSIEPVATTRHSACGVLWIRFDLMWHNLKFTEDSKERMKVCAMELLRTRPQRSPGNAAEDYNQDTENSTHSSQTQQGDEPCITPRCANGLSHRHM